jgi:HAD superfamily hydrolase (TIGR01549 family)
MNLPALNSEKKKSSHINTRVIFFDFGDTLIYFDGDWSKVLHRSTTCLWKNLVAAGYPLNREQFSQDFSDRMRNYYVERNKSLVEYTSASVLKNCLIDLGFPEPEPSIIRNALKALYSVSQEFWNLEEDTLPTLHWLKEKDFRLGLISNASDVDDVYALLGKFYLTDYFEHIIISAEFGLRKPHPDIFLEGLRLFQVEPQDCFMVGDRLDMDILGSNQVKMPSIWITRRSTQKGKEYGFDVKPDYEIYALSEIKEIIKSNGD